MKKKVIENLGFDKFKFIEMIAMLVWIIGGFQSFFKLI